MNKTLLLFISLSIGLFGFSENKKCILNGKVNAPNCKSIFLIKIQEDMDSEGLEIPVINGSIMYETILNQPEAYNLFLQHGGGRGMPIFLEPGIIDIIIHTEDEFEKNEIHGGKLNKQYAQFEKEKEKKFQPLFKPLSDSLKILKLNNNYYSDTMKIINALIEKTENREERSKLRKVGWQLEKENLYYSRDAKKIKEKQNDIRIKMNNWQYDYYNNNPTIVSYFLLLKEIYYSSDLNIEKVKKCINVLIQNNPRHTYNESFKIWLEKVNNIRIGGKYIDFTAPDLTGKYITLSDSITGKIVLINLWSTTCSPCIRHSREMIPIYNEFKNSNFTVIGIAGEYKDTRNLRYRLEKEKFPWLNLIELDKQNRIWDKYGISNSGGKMFLVDKDGSIIAIGPTAEEVKKILQNKLR